MTLLLDTHAFIWWDEDPTRLGSAARVACLDPNNDLFLSTASVWELQLKLMIGKLTVRKPLRQLVEDQVQQNGLGILQVSLEHVLNLDSLPFHHRDPFDRMLIAQAQSEGWSVVSHDHAFTQYAVSVVW